MKVATRPSDRPGDRPGDRPSDRPSDRPGAKVLLIANNYPPVRGGSAAVYANLARCADGQVIVMAPRINYADGLPVIGWREHDRQKPYRIVRLPLLRTLIGGPSQRGLGKAVFRLQDSYLRARLTLWLLWLIATAGVRAVCVGELLASSWIIRLLRYVPGVRTLVYVHGEEITTEDQFDHLHRRGREVLLESDGIIVVSRFTQQAVSDLVGPAGATRISLIENGVDTTRFHQMPRSTELTELYGLRGCFVFVSVCRLLEKNGIDNAIQAFARISALHSHCRYLVVGTGPFEATLREIAASADVADKVIFAGQVAEDELVEHYGLGDVFVMPNRELPNGDTEGFGLVFLEANSCGLPVIAGRDGGSTDAVRDGVNGLVVDGRSVTEIAGAMLALHDDPVQREAIRTRALAVAAGAGWPDKTRAFLAICSGQAG